MVSRGERDRDRAERERERAKMEERRRTPFTGNDPPSAAEPWRRRWCSIRVPVQISSFGFSFGFWVTTQQVKFWSTRESRVLLWFGLLPGSCRVTVRVQVARFGSRYKFS
ncbi:hypothetical protein Hanom_Chr16g01462491 [Helianthus anomalus]